MLSVTHLKHIFTAGPWQRLISRLSAAITGSLWVCTQHSAHNFLPNLTPKQDGGSRCSFPAACLTCQHLLPWVSCGLSSRIDLTGRCRLVRRSEARRDWAEQRWEVVEGNGRRQWSVEKHKSAKHLRIPVYFSTVGLSITKWRALPSLQGLHSVWDCCFHI